MVWRCTLLNHNLTLIHSTCSLIFVRPTVYLVCTQHPGEPGECRAAGGGTQPCHDWHRQGHWNCCGSFLPGPPRGKPLTWTKPLYPDLWSGLCTAQCALSEDQRRVCKGVCRPEDESTGLWGCICGQMIFLNSIACSCCCIAFSHLLYMCEQIHCCTIIWITF